MHSKDHGSGAFCSIIWKTWSVFVWEHLFLVAYIYVAVLPCLTLLLQYSSFHQYFSLLQVLECNEVFIYNAGQCIRWYVDWWHAKHIRGWLTGLSSPDFCVFNYTHCIWATSPVRQGLDPLPMVFIVALIFWLFTWIWNQQIYILLI